MAKIMPAHLNLSVPITEEEFCSTFYFDFELPYSFAHATDLVRSISLVQICF